MKKYLFQLLIGWNAFVVVNLSLLTLAALIPLSGINIFVTATVLSASFVFIGFGIFVGEKLNQSKIKSTTIIYLVFFTGLYIILLSCLKDPFFIIFEKWGIRLAVLLDSIFMLLIPICMNSAVVYVAIKKLRTDHISSDAHFIQTIIFIVLAMVVGIFFTIFTSIPRIGINRSFLLMGIVTALIAVIIFSFMKYKQKKGFITLGLFFIISLAFGFKYGWTDNASKGTVAVKKGIINTYKVLDYDDARFLLVNGTISAAVDTSTWRSIMPGDAVLESINYIFNKPGRLLMIGLTCGTLAKSFSAYGWNVDVVEPNNVVIEFAEKYFNLKKQKLTLINKDGREFLNHSKNKYDLIILSSPGNSFIISHLITQESFKNIAAHLNHGGYCASYVQSEGWYDVLVNSVSATMKTVFENVKVLPVTEPPDKIGNLVFLASNEKVELNCVLEREDDNDDYRFSSRYEQIHAWDNSFIPEISKGYLLSDDLNRSTLWFDRISIKDHEDLMNYFTRGENWK